jgi:hypothetical protein
VVDKLVYSDRVVKSLRSAVKDGRLALEDVPDLIKKTSESRCGVNE